MSENFRSCLPGWTFIGSSCVKLISSLTSLDRAQYDCLKQGSKLATFTTLKEKNELSNYLRGMLFKAGAFVLLGGTESYPYHWRWVNDKAMTTTPSSIFFNSIKSELCGRLGRSRKLEYGSCSSDRIGFVCQMRVCKYPQPVDSASLHRCVVSLNDTHGTCFIEHMAFFLLLDVRMANSKRKCTK